MSVIQKFRGSANIFQYPVSLNDPFYKVICSLEMIGQLCTDRLEFMEHCRNHEKYHFYGYGKWRGAGWRKFVCWKCGDEKYVRGDDCLSLETCGGDDDGR